MEIEERFHSNSHGRKTFRKRWYVNRPQAVVCLVHGIGEHCNRYEHLGAFLTDHKISLLGFDLAGHGRSSGRRGHISSFEVLMQQIDQVIEWAESLHPQVPIILYGHSMGGNIVLNYAIEQRKAVSGAISSGPWIRLVDPPSPLLMALAKTIHQVWPTFTQTSGLDSSDLSSSSEVVFAYQQDPLVHSKVTARTAVELFTAAERLSTYSDVFPIPLLLMHAAGDQITDPAGSVDFSRRVKGNIELKIWEDMLHEIHNEPRHDEVFEYMKNWILKL